MSRRFPSLFLGLFPFLFLFLLAAAPSGAMSAPLRVTRDGQETRHTPEALSRVPRYATLDLSATSEPFGTHVAAVPLDTLVPDTGPVVLTASDGFSVTLTPAMLRDAAAHGARAWIAIETTPRRWRTVRDQDMGPYALV